jgi:hypothetical protein
MLPWERGMYSAQYELHTSKIIRCFLRKVFFHVIFVLFHRLVVRRALLSVTISVRTLSACTSLRNTAVAAATVLICL